MKKTLFAMAALALCGTAFAREYSTSNYSNGDTLNSVALNDFSSITLNVNSPVVFTQVQLAPMFNPLTLNFSANNTLQAEKLYLGFWNGCPTAINGDVSALTSWGTQLTSSENITTITLASGSGETEFENLTDVTLNGQSANTSVTLGSATMTYVGYFTDMDEAKAAIADGTKVALVGVSSTTGGALSLVGKVGSTPATPEPATATLSLLALAGLASRRRRH